eukprot:19857-Heterococcus_DN1.PRE.2
MYTCSSATTVSSTADCCCHSTLETLLAPEPLIDKRVIGRLCNHSTHKINRCKSAPWHTVAIAPCTSSRVRTYAATKVCTLMKGLVKCSHHYADRCAQRCGLLVEQHTQHSTVPALSSSATGRAWFAATTA